MRLILDDTSCIIQTKSNEYQISTKGTGHGTFNFNVSTEAADWELVIRAFQLNA